MLKLFKTIFSEEKNFARNRIIGSKILNVLGLHVVRVLLSHFFFRVRIYRTSRNIPKEIRKKYLRDGIVVLENVLPLSYLDRLKDEVDMYQGKGTKFYEGSTRTWRVRLTPKKLEEFSFLQRAFKESNFDKYIKFCSASSDSPLWFIQVIQNLWRDGGKDVQRHLHSDTFHPTSKYWLYLSDVNIETSPLQFSYGSHRLNWRRIVWEYKKSLTAKNYNDGGTEQGSFRISEEDLVKLGYQKPQKLLVKSNTLVIANTYGFHKRSDAISRTNRIELWGYKRENPFTFRLSYSKDPNLEKLHAQLDGLEEKQLKKFEL